MNNISSEDLQLCMRVDTLLKRAETDKDSLYEFVADNEEIFKYAFLARAVVRDLIEPKPELFASISLIEEEFTEYVNQIEVDFDSEEDEESDEEED